MSPRIYVADLACYNAGILHGQWVDLDPDAWPEGLDEDALHARIQEILDEGCRLYARETCSGEHEEWAFHDYEGFGPVEIGEYTSIATILGHLERMGDDPNPYYAWIQANGAHYADDYDAEKVSGPYESASAWFDDYVSDYLEGGDLTDWLEKRGMPEHLASFVTWIEPEQFELIMSANHGVTLAEVKTGEYSREFYAVTD
jgi:antirestriction protein